MRVGTNDLGNVARTCYHTTKQRALVMRPCCIILHSSWKLGISRAKSPARLIALELDSTWSLYSTGFTWGTFYSKESRAEAILLRLMLVRHSCGEKGNNVKEGRFARLGLPKFPSAMMERVRSRCVTPEPGSQESAQACQLPPVLCSSWT